MPCSPTPCTPAGPLSEAAAEERHANGGPGRGAAPPLLRPGASSGLGQAGGAGAQQQQGQEQQRRQQEQGDDEEGDNRSFYGSDSQVGISCK